VADAIEPQGIASGRGVDPKGRVVLVAEHRELRVVDAEPAEHNAGNPSQPAKLTSSSEGCVRTQGIQTGERNECAIRSISEAVLGRPQGCHALVVSRLRDLDEDLIGRITEGSRRLDVSPGEIRDIGSVMFDLVLRGLARIFVIAPGGREAMLGYCRPGSLMGTAIIFSPLPSVARQKALVPSPILVMRPAIVRSLAETDARVALALLRERATEPRRTSPWPADRPFHRCDNASPLTCWRWPTFPKSVGPS
jgi:hypothetical protein